MLIKGNQVNDNSYFFNQKVVTDRTVTIVGLEIEVANDDGTVTRYYASGNSMRMTGDKYSQHTGELIATWRAVKQLDNMLSQAVKNLEA